jgi:hypothetical protein
MIWDIIEILNYCYYSYLLDDNDYYYADTDDYNVNDDIIYFSD